MFLETDPMSKGLVCTKQVQKPNNSLNTEFNISRE